MTKGIVLRSLFFLCAAAWSARGFVAVVVAPGHSRRTIVMTAGRSARAPAALTTAFLSSGDGEEEGDWEPPRLVYHDVLSDLIPARSWAVDRQRFHRGGPAPDDGASGEGGLLFVAPGGGGGGGSRGANFTSYTRVVAAAGDLDADGDDNEDAGGIRGGIGGLVLREMREAREGISSDVDDMARQVNRIHDKVDLMLDMIKESRAHEYAEILAEIRGIADLLSEKVRLVDESLARKLDSLLRFQVGAIVAMCAVAALQYL